MYERKPGSDGTVDDLLRSGADCICAGYVAYSSAVELVFTFKGQAVHGFCLDSTIGEFVHTREKMVFPVDGGKRIYSCNEGNSDKWDEVSLVRVVLHSTWDFAAWCPFRHLATLSHTHIFLQPIKAAVEGFKSDAKPYTARYVGSMVADIHRTILYGGIYLYPADAKSKKGKLRLLYEGIPMAMIIEQAGGVASAGMYQGKIQRVLDLLPESIHDKCPIIMGGARDVQRVFDEYAKAGVAVPQLLETAPFS